MNPMPGAFLLLLFAAPALSQPCDPGAIETSAPKQAPAADRIAQMAQQGSAAPGLAIGDSVIYLWPQASLESTFGGPVEKIALGGAKLENMAHILASAPTFSATKVLVEIGAANIRFDDACVFSVKARALARLIREHAPKANVYLVSMIPRGPFAKKFDQQYRQLNDAWRSVADANGFRFVDVYDELQSACDAQESCALYKPDRVHPSPAGYEALTRALSRTLAAEKR